jgi:archaellum component FlaC
MIQNRKNPESSAMLSTPKFIKVVYDEKGKPIDIIPMENGPSNLGKEDQNGQTKTQSIVLPNNNGIEKQVMANWIVNLGQHVRALREELRLMAIFTQKKFDELQPIISTQIENSISKNSPIERFTFIENEISNLKNRLDSLNSQISNFEDHIDSLPRLIENSVSKPLPIVMENLQLLSSNVSNLTEKLEELKIPEKMILDQLKSLDLRMSTIANEIGNSKLHEIETTEKMKSLVEEMKNSKVSDFEILQSLSSLGNEVEKLNQEVLSTNSNIENEISTLNQKIENMASSTNQKIETVTSNMDQIMDEFSILTSNLGQRIESLSSNQGKLIANLTNDIEQRFSASSLRQEELITKFYEKTNRKFTKLLNKMKKKEKGPSRARIVRLFKKKLNLPSFNKILIVSDKRNSNFGTLLFDVARKMNKKTVLVTMENRKALGIEPEECVKEAMGKSDRILVVAKYSLEKTKALEECLAQGKKVFAIKKSLRVTPLSL